MKRAVLFTLFAILSINVFADTKVKIRQTMSGQTYENTTYIKGKRERAEQNTGGMQTVTITQCDLKRSLRIMPVSKTYMVDSWADTPSVAPTTTQKTVSVPTTKGGVITSTVTIKDTGERKQMFGYTARRLIITTEMNSSPEACNKTKMKMETDGWYIDATFGLDCENDRSASFIPKAQNGGCKDRFESKQIGTGKRGFPLYEKMTMFDESGKESFSTISEVVEFSKATLDDSLFDVPKDYREVKDYSEMYQTANYSNSSTYSNSSSYGSTNSGLSQTVSNASKTNQTVSTEVGAKKTGVIRIGLASVKTGAIGEGMNANDLSNAVQNTLGEYLKGTKVELVALEAKLALAIADEAKQKECDFVLFATVSHKKGGGGFGGFGKVLGQVVQQTGGGAWGNTAANNAGRIASQSIVAATSNIKSKDEISLDVKMQKTSDNSSSLAKQLKGKAKSDGEDILSPIIEQIANSIIEAVGK